MYTCTLNDSSCLSPQDFKDRNDLLQSDLEKTMEELKKYRRKAQILRKKEKQLRMEHQRLLEEGRVASGPSPDVVQQVSQQALPSSSSLEDEEETTETAVELEELEDDEGVEHTEDTLSEGEEKSLHGELHELELRAAKKSERVHGASPQARWGDGLGICPGVL